MLEFTATLARLPGKIAWTVFYVPAEIAQGLGTKGRITVRGTEEVVESYLRQYQIGRKGWLDVLNAQRERSQAKAALSDVEYSLELSKLRFMLLTGDITSTTLATIHD